MGGDKRQLTTLWGGTFFVRRAVTQHASSPGEPGKGDPELLLTERRNSIAENVHQDDGRNSPLTLSQISPRKAADSHRNPPAMDPGGGWSMRQSTKRPASEASSSQPATKKGRSHANASDEASAIITRGLRSAGSRAPAKNSSSSSGSRRVRRRVQETRDSDGEGTLLGQKKPTVRKSVLEKSSGEDVTGNLSRSDSRCSSSGVSNPRLSRSNNLATSGTWVQGDGEAGTLRSMGMPACHERVSGSSFPWFVVQPCEGVLVWRGVMSFFFPQKTDVSIDVRRCFLPQTRPSPSDSSCR